MKRAPVIADDDPAQAEPVDDRSKDCLASHIRDAINAGRFVPGQRLVEAELTAEYGVSRGPLREALRQLSAEGLVELMPHRSAQVRRLTRTEILELFHIRARLEAMAGQLAASRMNLPDIRDRFSQAVAMVFDDKPRLSTAEYVCENNSFHGAILRAAGNSQLVRLYENMQLGLIMSQISAALPTEIVATSLKEHRQIAEAILAADEKRAADLLFEHLTRAMDFMRLVPDKFFRKAYPAD
jgi:DNA-binding GntR family transcriptional regulator